MTTPSRPSRRDMIKGVGYAANLVGMLSAAERRQRVKPRVFALVHPAWHGAWFWKKIVPLLSSAGHFVVTPTLTGLGDRSHLARPDISLDTHITDVVNILKSEDLHEVVLVGHSSSGVVVTGVADRAPDRLTHVVYLDAFVPGDGQSVFDLVTPDRRRMMEEMVTTEGEGWLLPRFAPPPWETIVREMWGVTDERDVRWMLERLGPTPASHFRDAVRRTNPAAEKLTRVYIRCTQFKNPRFDQHAEMAQRSANWRYGELASSHHAPVTIPEKVVDLLLELSS